MRICWKSTRCLGLGLTVYKKIKMQSLLLNRITVNGIIWFMRSNSPRLIKSQMSLNSILSTRNIFVIVIIRLMESVVVWPKVTLVRRVYCIFVLRPELGQSGRIPILISAGLPEDWKRSSRQCNHRSTTCRTDIWSATRKSSFLKIDKNLNFFLYQHFF
jgi:hypothetical protein